MGRRLKPRFVRDAAAREKRDPVGAEEPRGALGRIARVRILREQDQEPPAELLVQRCQHERERGLGDACPGGKRLHERLESLAGSELRDKGIERRLVHAKGGKQPPAGAYPSALRMAPDSPRPSCPSLSPTSPRGTPVPLQARYRLRRDGFAPTLCRLCDA